MPAPQPPSPEAQYILTATCEARKGIVAAVTTFLSDNDCYICALEQFDDDSTARFFMQRLLPDTAALHAKILAGAGPVMAMDEAMF